MERQTSFSGKHGEWQNANFKFAICILQFAIPFLYSARQPSDLRLSPKAEECSRRLAAGPRAFQRHQVSLAGAVGGPSKLASHLAHSRFLKLASVGRTIPPLG